MVRFPHLETNENMALNRKFLCGILGPSQSSDSFSDTCEMLPTFADIVRKIIKDENDTLLHELRKGAKFLN